MENCYESVKFIENANEIIGKQDAILLYGIEPQHKIRDISRAISRIMLNSNADTGQKIDSIIQEIEKTKMLNKKSIFEKLFDKKKNLIQSYKTIISYMDKVTVDLQLQQARTIKETRLLEEMEKELSVCYSELSTFISEGQKIEIQADNDNSVGEYWKERFKKRLEELGTSHTLLLQMQAQIQLLRKNNDQLVDQISFAISGTIPIWRTQINMLIGIEKSTYNDIVNEKVMQVTEQSVKEKSRDLKKKIKSIDVEQVDKVNSKLTSVLEKLISLETNDTDIKTRLNNCLTQ